MKGTAKRWEKQARLGGNICQKKSLKKHPDQKYVQKLFKKSN